MSDELCQLLSNTGLETQFLFVSIILIWKNVQLFCNPFSARKEDNAVTIRLGKELFTYMGRIVPTRRHLNIIQGSNAIQMNTMIIHRDHIFTSKQTGRLLMTLMITPAFQLV